MKKQIVLWLILLFLVGCAWHSLTDDEIKKIATTTSEVFSGTGRVVDVISPGTGGAITGIGAALAATIFAVLKLTQKKAKK